MNTARRRLLAPAATVGLAAVALGLAAVLAREEGRTRDRPATPSEREPPDARAARLASVPGAALRAEVDTPQEVRSVVRHCREAGRSSAEELRRAALASDDPCVAGNALRALGRLGLAPGAAGLADLLDDPRPRVRQEAVIALGRSGDPMAVERLAPLLRSEDPTLRALAIQALGRLGGTSARSLVEGILSDPAATASDCAFARAALTDAEPVRIAATR